MADTAKSLEKVLGTTIINNKGETIEVANLASTRKSILLYFSAHWCPPCRGFTPKLSKAFEEYKQSCEGNQEMDIVFISSDKDVDAFKEYHSEMTFLAIPYEERELKATLSKKFEIEGIPSLVLVDNHGETIVMEGDASPRSLIEEHGADAFPLTKEKVEELKAASKAKQAAALENLVKLPITFEPVSYEDEKKEDSPTHLMDYTEQYDYVGLLLGDGDFGDPSYDTVVTMQKELNGDGKAEKFMALYIGWSLYNNESSHGAFSEKFHVLSDPSDELRSCLSAVAAGRVAAPMMIVLRKGVGLCGIDGICRGATIPEIISTDLGLQRMKMFGSRAFPWDDTSIEAAKSAETARVERYRSRIPNLHFLKRNDADKPVIIKGPKGDSQLEEALVNTYDDTIVALYFSAHWCPPCRALTPKLLKCYEEVNEAASEKKRLEVIFFSFDNDENEFEEYFASMKTPQTGKQWLAVDYSEREFHKDVSNLFGIQGFPSLVLLKKDGTVLSHDATTSLAKYGSSCFPWSEEEIQKHKVLLEKQE